MSKIPKWLKITGGVLVGLFILIAIVGSSSEQNNNQITKNNEATETQEVADTNRCEDVPDNIVADINEGFNTEGLTFRNAQTVKSNDFKSVYFISGDIQGAGLEGDDDIATFATNSLEGTGGILMSVDGVAKEFSVFPDASTTDAKASMSDDGAKQSKDCVNR